MKRIRAMALALCLLTGVIAGCAPGDVSRYVQRAQQAGEALFEGKTVEAAVLQEETQGTEQAQNQETLQDMQEEMHLQSQTTKEDRTVSKSAEAQETLQEEEQSVQQETAAPAVTEVDGETAEFFVLEESLQEDLQEVLAGQADRYNGRLAGTFEPDGICRAALEAVGERVGRQEDLAALVYMPENITSGQGEAPAAILLADTQALQLGGTVRGDLWLVEKGRAWRVAKEETFTAAFLTEIDGTAYLLVQGEVERQKKAQVYVGKKDSWEASFNDAREVTLTGNICCVSYASSYLVYNPFLAEWEAKEALTPYFYEVKSSGIICLAVRAISEKEYRDYLLGAPSKIGEEEVYSSYFMIGDRYVGRREARLIYGGDGRVRLAWRYELEPLTSENSGSIGGEGYYFTDWSRREEEMAALMQPPSSLALRRSCVFVIRRILTATESRKPFWPWVIMRG